MFYVTKKLSNAAISHRLRNKYPGKCKNLHGHEYYFEVTLKSEKLDEYGMVIDFGEIKNMFDKWIQENWDHGTIVSLKDKSLYNWLTEEKMKMFVIQDDFAKETNITAEWMSYFLFKTFKEMLVKEYESVYLIEVKVWETETSFATYKE